MNRDQRNIIILAVLLVGVVGALFYSFNSASPPAGTPAPGAAGASATAAGSMVESVFEDTDVDIEELFKKIEDVEFDYSLVREARNPMVPLVGRTQTILNDEDVVGGVGGPTPEDEEVIYRAYQKTLTGVVWDESDPLAVMNDGLEDIVVYQGYEFPNEGIVVSAIAKDHVVLTLNLAGQQREIIRELTEEEL